MWEAQGEFWCSPVGPIKEAIEEFVEYVDGLVLEVTPVIFDESVGGRCFDVTGKGIDSIELRPRQRPITGHKFVTLIFAHLYYPPYGVHDSISHIRGQIVR